VQIEQGKTAILLMITKRSSNNVELENGDRQLLLVGWWVCEPIYENFNEILEISMLRYLYLSFPFLNGMNSKAYLIYFNIPKLVTKIAIDTRNCSYFFMSYKEIHD
jgi:hypothetical protein